MIQEDHVSFEIAKLLKKKGFEYNLDESYWIIDSNETLWWISRIGGYDYVDNPTEPQQRPKNSYRTVTIQMAMKWLREVYKRCIVISPEATDDDGSAGCLWQWRVSTRLCVQCTSEDLYELYEEACEAAIKYCLEKLV